MHKIITRIINLAPVLLFALFIFSFNFKIVNDPDFWWHIRYGEEIVNNKTISSVDTFSYTYKGIPILASEWIPEVIYYSVFSRWSFLGLAILSGLMITITLLLPLLVFKGSFLLRFVILIWSMFGLNTIFTYGARAQTAGWLMFGIFIAVILKYLETKKNLFILTLPLIFLAWANIHPSYLLGLGILFFIFASEIMLGIFISWREKRPKQIISIKSPIVIIFIFILSVFMTTVKPVTPLSSGGNTFDMIKTMLLPSNFVSDSVTGSVRREIAEWLPPVFINTTGTMFLIAIIFSVGILIISTDKLVIGKLPMVILLFGLIYYSTLSRRNSPFFYIYFIPFVIYFINSLIIRIKQSHLTVIINIFIVVFITLAIVVKIPESIRSIESNSQSMDIYCNKVNYCPYKAVQYIKINKPKGNMFNFYDWGGYLIWELRDYPVFIDGRVPGQPTFNEYMEVVTFKENWKEVIKKYNVGWLLVPNSVIIQTMFEKEGWKKIYSDDMAMIILR